MIFYIYIYIHVGIDDFQRWLVSLGFPFQAIQQETQESNRCCKVLEVTPNGGGCSHFETYLSGGGYSKSGLSHCKVDIGHGQLGNLSEMGMKRFMTHPSRKGFLFGFLSPYLPRPDWSGPRAARCIAGEWALVNRCT